METQFVGQTVWSEVAPLFDYVTHFDESGFEWGLHVVERDMYR
jgi:hypothetical protein